jgi:hypothetical protein
LPAVRSLRRGERRRDFVGELAFLPEAAGLVDELLQLGCDIAETGRRSERDAVGPLEVVQRRDRLVGDDRAVSAPVLVLRDEELRGELLDVAAADLGARLLGAVVRSRPTPPWPIHANRNRTRPGIGVTRSRM